MTWRLLKFPTVLERCIFEQTGNAYTEITVHKETLVYVFWPEGTT